MRGSLLNSTIRLAAFVVILGAPASAQAFYWAGWPGAGDTEPPSITPRQVTEKTVPPREPFEPHEPHEPGEPPKGVPEPATLVIAGLGLGVLGLRKVLKRTK